MNTLKHLYKAITLGIGLSVVPLYIAHVLNLNTFAFLVVYYFLALIFYAGAHDVKGQNIASFRNEKPDKILFPFPLNDWQSDLHKTKKTGTSKRTVQGDCTTRSSTQQH